jgi:hypothetical protein
VLAYVSRDGKERKTFPVNDAQKQELDAKIADVTKARTKEKIPDGEP